MKKFTFFLLVKLLVVFSAHSQSIGGLASYGCTGSGSTYIFYLTSGSGCSAPQVTVKSNWHVYPMTGVSVNVITTGNVNGKDIYNRIEVTIQYPGTYTVSTGYSCASGGTGGSADSAPFPVYDPVVPTTQLVSDKTSICGNDSELITFTASGTNGGTNPQYNWLINGTAIVVPPTPTFKPSSVQLNNGDVVSVKMVSDKACANPRSIISNPITVSVADPTPVSATIHSTFDEVCPGNGIAFIADVMNGGDTPSVQWLINGSTAAPTDEPRMGPNYLIYNHWNYPNNSYVEFSVTSSLTGCVAPKPAKSNKLTIPLKTKQAFTAGISILPNRYPMTYMEDEIYFVANTSYAASQIYWYKNGQNLGSGSVYDPVHFAQGDVVSLQAYAAENGCLLNTSATATTSGAPITIVQNVPITPISCTGCSGGYRCQGAGTTQFTASRTGSGTIRWVLSQAGSSTINPQTGLVTWASNFSGTATITAWADDVGMAQSINCTTVAEPASPTPESITKCTNELVVLDSYSQSGYAIWYDNNTPVHTGDTYELGCIKDPLSKQYKILFTTGSVCVSKLLSLEVTENCDANLNWIEDKKFAGDGVVITKDSRIYYDNNGNVLQSQHKTLNDNKVLITQPVKDRYERLVGNTLPAPGPDSGFGFSSKFFSNVNGGPYGYKDFDDGATSTTPLPVGSSTSGTLGWYYSQNNSIEPLTAKTQYPYSRIDFYSDGSMEQRFAATPGDQHRLGKGHEILTGTFPVFNELTDYLSRRPVVFPGIVQDGVLTNEGFQHITRDVNGKVIVQIMDKAGKLVMSARAGTPANSHLAVSNTVTADLNVGPGYRPMIYFYLLHPQTVTITATGSYTVDDLLTGQTITPSGSWPVGFYRVTATSGSTTVTYQNHFLDVSYSFYDDAGRLTCIVSPNGFIKWKEVSTSATNYPVIDKTVLSYNFKGQLVSRADTDEGISKFLYRKDGKIRFSQNAEQATAGKDDFSYTNYDGLGRPVESGHFVGTEYSFSTLTGQLEFQTQITFNAASVKDWIRTYYDYPAASIPNLPSSFKQEYLRGAVSWTENANSQSWYSYDERGNVTWFAQKPAMMNQTFVSQYTYDLNGAVIKKKSSTYINGTEFQPFYHHYEYDGDRRLSKVYTSIDDSSLKLRANYLYYLHGPLKRVVLGENLQGIDFIYNIQGWLTQINHPDKALDPGGDTNDVFGMVLDYYESSVSGLITASSLHDPRRFHMLDNVAWQSSLAGSKEDSTLKRALNNEPGKHEGITNHPSIIQNQTWK